MLEERTSFFCYKLQPKVSKLKLKAHLLLCPSITIRFGSCRVPDPLLICRSSFCLPKSNCTLPICVLQLQVNGAGHQHLCHLFPLPLRWSGQITTYGSGIAPPNPNSELPKAKRKVCKLHWTCNTCPSISLVVLVWRLKKLNCNGLKQLKLHVPK